MDRAGIPFEEIKEEMFKDENFRREYEELQPQYEAIEQIIRTKNREKYRNLQKI